MIDVVVAIERLTALVFIVTGLSHVAAPREWARFFIAMRDESAVPAFLNAYVHGPLGFLIVAFHWVWSWPQAVVTAIGCGLTLKATLYFLFPGLARHSMADVSEDKAWRFRAAGVAGLALGMAVGWFSFGAPSP